MGWKPFMGLVVLSIAFTAVAQVPLALAQQDGADSGEPSLEALAMQLGDAKRETVSAALQAVAIVGTPEAIALLSQRIREGLPADLVEVALDTLSLLNTPSSAAVVQELARHRTTKIRTRAVTALADLQGEITPEAKEMLLQALEDLQSPVRSAAARALSKLGVEAALPSLFSAFEHGVYGSSDALAQLAKVPHLARILGYVGTYPFQNVGPILRALIQREDWPDSAKSKIVARLREVATTDARALLEGVVRSPSPHVSPQIREEAKQAASHIAP